MVSSSVIRGGSRTRALLAGALTLHVLVASSHAEAAEAGLAPVSDAQLAAPLDRATCLRAALARSPALRSARLRARAASEDAEAEGRLPDPEVTLDVWQVPLARPHAVGDGQMVMVGAKQSFPAPGVQGARRDARREDARAEQLTAQDRAREVVREVEHAFVDYVEAVARHGVHRAHADASLQILELARARYESGAPLADAAQAEVDLRRVEADVVTDASLVGAARARLNALLLRPRDAALGEPVAGEPATVAADAESLLARSVQGRSDVRALDARREAVTHELRAASREATWPSFSVGVLYFAPTTPMPHHGYGTSLSMSMPWIWGAAGARRVAAASRVEAAREDIAEARSRVALDVATTLAAADRGAYRLLALRDVALPAARRSQEAALSGYESGRTGLPTVLTAARGVVEIGMEIVMARAALDHALADLDWAAGAPVARAPLRPLPPGAGHGASPGGAR